MIKLILTLVSFNFVYAGFSQTNISPNVLGEPFQGQSFKVKASNDVEGNPFLFTDWKSGEITLKDDEKFRVEKINLDASRDKFIYYKNDTMYEFFDDVKEIKIFNGSNSDTPGSEMIFRSDISPTAANFVQVLARGKVTIFEEYEKKPEGENYSNGIVNNTRKYVLHSNQYALVGNKEIPIKFSSSTLDDLTSDKKSQVNTFIKENNLKVKKENDFLKAIIFYNTISTSSS